MKLTLPYPPSVNRYWRMVRGMMILSAEARDYKKDVSAIALDGICRHQKPLLGPVAVSIAVYRPRKSGDLDNTLKAVLDSIKGIAYVDDSQVEYIQAFRYDDKENPRVEIEIKEIK